jgi:hypothetical protein
MKKLKTHRAGDVFSNHPGNKCTYLELEEPLAIHLARGSSLNFGRWFLGLLPPLLGE